MKFNNKYKLIDSSNFSLLLFRKKQLGIDPNRMGLVFFCQIQNTFLFLSKNFFKNNKCMSK